MSPNKELPHVLVLPEDDANRQLARGFHLQIDSTRQRQMQILQPANGWSNVMEVFLSDHVPEMDRYPTRAMVLVIDYDEDEKRLDRCRDRVPNHLAERVFILGSFDEPEKLTNELGAYEIIGAGMAKDCREGTDTTWGHNHLRHNAGELERLRAHLYAILFASQ